MIQFLAIAGKTYTVLYRDAAEGGPWQKLADAGGPPATRIVTLFDPSSQTARQRFYRLATPAQP